MYVCICKGITDNDIRHAIYQGASSIKQVSKQLGVSSQCGQCACLAKSIVDETLEDIRHTNSGLFYAA